MTAENKKRNEQKKRNIPVLWDNTCRNIPICVSTLTGIQKMATKKNCAVEVYPNCAELEKAADTNDTVIVVGFESVRLPKLIHRLQLMNKQVVVTNMDADHIDSHYSCATFSRRIATEQMLEFLYSKGCRCFALVGCGHSSVNDMVHREALRSYLTRSQERTYGRSFWYRENIRESFDTFLEDSVRYDAVLCPNEFAAVAFLHFCEENGMKVPDQFLLATIKGDQISQFCKPSITSFSIDFFAIGVNSVNVWLFLQNPENSSLQMRITIPGRIIERESTGSTRAGSDADLKSFPSEDFYRGGPFYHEPTLRALMRIGSCLQAGDELDIQIIQSLIGRESYESIAENLFLCESSLQYRIRKIFQNAHVKDRRSFVRLFEDNFTQSHHFGDYQNFVMY